MHLRLTTPADLETLFTQQLDPATNLMAGTKPRPREIFFATWKTIFADLNDPDQKHSSSIVVPRVMILEGKEGVEIVGTISRFHRDSKNFVGYFIARPHWGKGFATKALALLLGELSHLPQPRPLCANTAATHVIAARVTTMLRSIGPLNPAQSPTHPQTAARSPVASSAPSALCDRAAIGPPRRAVGSPFGFHGGYRVGEQALESHDAWPA
ncbi:MAG: GNAT family N-acetyltransferase [Deltaproteobacteria bacterium]|nr:GNAT family N-acetyltransferase [Deltaproteobacteria bacterium]